MKLTPLLQQQPEQVVYPKNMPYKTSILTTVQAYCSRVLLGFQGRHKCRIHPKSKFVYQTTGEYQNVTFAWRLGKLNEDFVVDPETVIPTMVQDLAEIEADLREALSYIETKRATIVEDIRNAVKEGLDGKV